MALCGMMLNVMASQRRCDDIITKLCIDCVISSCNCILLRLWFVLLAFVWYRHIYFALYSDSSLLCTRAIRVVATLKIIVFCICFCIIIS